MMERCPWCLGNEKMIRYHDEEWGVPVHDDRKQFEFLMMEVMQCGLNWNMMIQKREIFRTCFDNFGFDKVAVYGEGDIERIMGTDGMIRSRRKIEAVIHNAQCFQKIREEFGSFSEYIWELTRGKTYLLYGPPERQHPSQKRSVQPDQCRPEKAGTEIYGFCHGLFPFAGLRHYQRPLGRVFPI